MGSRRKGAFGRGATGDPSPSVDKTLPHPRCVDRRTANGERHAVKHTCPHKELTLTIRAMEACRAWTQKECAVPFGTAPPNIKMTAAEMYIGLFTTYTV